MKLHFRATKTDEGTELDILDWKEPNWHMKDGIHYINHTNFMTDYYIDTDLYVWDEKSTIDPIMIDWIRDIIQFRRDTLLGDLLS